MRHTAFLILVLGLALFSTAEVQNELKDNGSISALNGAAWKKLPLEARLAYVRGYLDAAIVHRMIITNLGEQCPQTLLWMTDFRKNNPGWGNTGVDAITQGIDTLYEDYRNTNIHVVAALRVVSLELSGRPASEIEAVLREARRMSLSTK